MTAERFACGSGQILIAEIAGFSIRCGCGFVSPRRDTRAEAVVDLEQHLTPRGLGAEPHQES